MSTKNSQNTGNSFDYSNMDISYNPSTGSSPASVKADSVKETSKYDVDVEYNDVQNKPEAASQTPVPEPVQTEPVVVSAVSEPEVETQIPASTPEDDDGFVVPSDFTKKAQYPTNPEPETADEAPEVVSLTGNNNESSEINPLFDADDGFIYRNGNPLIDTEDVNETPDVSDNDEDDDWTSKFEPKFKNSVEDTDDNLENESEFNFRNERQKTKESQKIDKKPFSAKGKKPAPSKKKGGRSAKNDGSNKKNTAVLIALVILILAVLGVGGYLVYQNMYKPEPAPVESGFTNLTLDTNANDEKELQNPLSSRNVYFAGIDNSTCGPNTVIYLENLEENEDFLMKYQIYELEEDGSKGEQLFETDLIPSGQHVNWKPAETLTPGVHNVTFVELPFMPQGEDFIPLTAGENNVVLTIVE